MAVASTVAQLGMVNALFRFALERDRRGALGRRAHGDPLLRLTGAAVAWRGAGHAAGGLGDLLGAGRRRSGWWPASGCWVSLLNEALVGLYRVEARPGRFRR